MDEKLKTAVDVLKNGGIVIFPTDTAFGIGCRIDNEKSVSRLFGIRKRPKHKAVSVLVDSIGMTRAYVEEIPQNVEKLMEKYWPGALTIILRSDRENVPSLVRGGGQTLGVRMPNYKIILKIISEVGMPILGPSANFSDEKTPFRFEDLNTELIKKADYVLYGETGLEKDVSTVIDCTVTPWKIIRQGAVKISNF